jgi:hypothetical protein
MMHRAERRVTGSLVGLGCVALDGVASDQMLCDQRSRWIDGFGW